MHKHHQVSIIGAGPAGLAAATYLVRAGRPPLVFERNIPGGLLLNAHSVENYPGFPHGIKGSELVDLFLQQFTRIGGTLHPAEVCCISKLNDHFSIQTKTTHYTADVVILASGTIPKKITIPGSENLEGTKLFYDVYFLLKNNNLTKKRILVLGGGDAAFDYSLSLHEAGAQVSLLLRSEPKALGILQQRVCEKGIPLFTKHQPQEILVQNHELILTCTHQHKTFDFVADFIVVAYGRIPNSGFLTSELQTAIQITSAFPATTISGLYVAGDVARMTHRQVGIAVGDGIHAAMHAIEYLDTRKGC
ncbi:MAG: NAD(P)/FAD-dependent oxidoreductase [Candidatus Thermoplasmatota archaeon]